ncbi:PGDYG domain-containing protein [Sporolactobacillus shoreicorticis]|uniref:PGDYG domain-containing protein n=1 Tax=Sporolactobacillus shoreicorticis TaxID=1923877 RepID=A0ABW5S5Y2_9BACL|nr:PGDYG domain-containing protein [Sporolactobacillus shoreicorticis]MCO7127805.1 PGDYG domain-containing protein [Sporolactobacillus shoreicorticis]
MPKYRKKPVVIEAELYRPGLEDGFKDAFVSIGQVVRGEKIKIQKRPFIHTLEGDHIISPGDYIITGVEGERYPCKPDIFEKTYEKVE